MGEWGGMGGLINLYRYQLKISDSHTRRTDSENDFVNGSVEAYADLSNQNKNKTKKKLQHTSLEELNLTK